MKRMIPFNYFGSKYRHLDWLLSLLPKSYSFVDVFGGSGVVIINREPSRIDTFNDIDNCVINFFEILRNNTEQLLHKLEYTPYSYEEFCKASNKYLLEKDPIEKARMFFVMVNQGFANTGIMGRNVGWGKAVKSTNCLISENVNNWINKIKNLPQLINRLKQLQIHNASFETVIESFDTKRTLFYCDPPYRHKSRTSNNDYKHEMSDLDHIRLADILNNIEGKVAISGYEDPLYNELYKDYYKHKAPVSKQNMSHTTRQEILWTNYEVEEELRLF